jgi:hypothetical protein
MAETLGNTAGVEGMDSLENRNGVHCMGLK